MERIRRWEWPTRVLSNLKANNLWQRTLKYTIATTLSVILAVLPSTVSILGSAAFLAPMTTVFAHPGQRLGLMVESLALIVSGTLLGVGWSFLGLFLSSFVLGPNIAAACTVRGIFLVIAAIFHGYFRSYSPRLFIFILFALIPSIIMLLSTTRVVTRDTATQIVYPVLSAAGIVLVVNVIIFPELSSSLLGSATLESLSLTADSLRDATDWFVKPVAALTDADEQEPKPELRGMCARELAALSDRKVKLRARLQSCNSAQDECSFELAFSVLPPRSLKPVTSVALGGLVQNAVSLIDACEGKYAVMSVQQEDGGELEHLDVSEDAEAASGESSGDLADKLKLVKPRRELEYGDVELLESILTEIRGPIGEFQEHIDQAMSAVVAGLAYCCDIPKLPSGSASPKGIQLEELDTRVDLFEAAISNFDKSSAEALGKAASIEGINETHVDILPRAETFLVSSFLLSLRSAATYTMDMLRHVRNLVESRQRKKDRRRIYFPRKTNWRTWLSTGGEHDGMVLPERARKETWSSQRTRNRANTGESGSKTTHIPHPPLDEELGLKPRVLPGSSIGDSEGNTAEKSSQKVKSSLTSATLRMRGVTADVVEAAFASEDLSYALKLAIALFLVSFPALAASTNAWYASAHGVWAPLQLILVFEVAIGTSFFVFAVRAAGVVFGCVFGYLAYAIGRGNLVALVILLVLGIIPSAYVQLGTTYVKAGMISVVSMTVVALATVNRSGTAEENFAKRLAAFIVGGTVALLIQTTLYPVKARSRLVESISSCLQQVGNMQLAVAPGVDQPVKVNLRDPKLHARFRRAKTKAQAALSAAETFLPFCLSEPRLKGSFRELQPIYKEIIYVLHHIIDRMDSMMQLRKAYGSSVLEDFNPLVYTHRRNVAASITMSLLAVDEALTTRLPLPQFLPSSRLAQLRLIHRVREVLAEQSLLPSNLRRRSTNPTALWNRSTAAAAPLDEQTIRSVTTHKFLAWNAAAAGQMEIIEYLEELVDLVKLLVGVNAFRSGMLERPNYREYVRRIRTKELSLARGQAVVEGIAGEEDGEGRRGSAVEDSTETEMRRRRRTSSGAAKPSRVSFSKVEGRRVAEPEGEATKVSRVERLRDRISETKPAEALISRGEAPQDLPPSLRRVATRMGEERGNARRMTLRGHQDKGKGHATDIRFSLER